MLTPFPSLKWLAAVSIPTALAAGGSGGATPAGPGTQTAATPAPTPTRQPTPTPFGGVRDDESLWDLLSRVDPFTGYRPFPNVEEIAIGRLDGSGAHPRVRVTLNDTAFRALENGKLPPGGRFPNGSVIFKEVLGQDIYAVMRKENGGPVSGANWAWAEFRPNGSVVYGTGGRGGACIECHSRQMGPQNDLVRTFERQR